MCEMISVCCYTGRDESYAWSAHFSFQVNGGGDTERDMCLLQGRVMCKHTDCTWTHTSLSLREHLDVAGELTFILTSSVKIKPMNGYFGKLANSLPGGEPVNRMKSAFSSVQYSFLCKNLSHKPLCFNQVATSHFHEGDMKIPQFIWRESKTKALKHNPTGRREVICLSLSVGTITAVTSARKTWNKVKFKNEPVHID